MAGTTNISNLVKEMDDRSMKKLERLCRDLGFESHGKKPSITRLMRAVAKVDATVLEEVLSDAGALPGQRQEKDEPEELE